MFLNYYGTGGVVTLPVPPTLEYLIVGGGGSGGTSVQSSSVASGGGGGAGGFLTNTNYSVAGSDTITVNIGAGGTYQGQYSNAIGIDGGNSYISSTFGGTITAYGGGGGANVDTTVAGKAHNGGSGGGSSSKVDSNWGTGTAGQGNNGGLGFSNVNEPFGGAGGGGGAGGPGLRPSGVVNGQSGTGGDGGSGAYSSITGINTPYAGGGGGGVSRNSGDLGFGGIGGGGRSNAPIINPNFVIYHTDATMSQPGDKNTGGGGGGEVNAPQNTGISSRIKTPGTGGSGIVVLRHLSTYKVGTCVGSPLIYVTSDNYVVYIFKNNGSITF